MDLIKLATLIHNKREEIGIPLAVAAKRAGIGHSTLENLERGKNPRTGKPSRPGRHILEQLAPVLRMNQEELNELLLLADYAVTKQPDQNNGFATPPLQPEPSWTPHSVVTPPNRNIAALSPQITMANGKVFVYANGSIQAYDEETGKRLWSSSTRPTDIAHDTLPVATNAQTVKTVQDKFPELIPEIKTPVPLIKLIADAEIKCGQSAKEIYEEAFSGNEIRACVNVEEVSKLSSNNAKFFSEALQKNQKLKMWEIISESHISRRAVMKISSKMEILLKDNERYTYKLMPDDLNWRITFRDIVIYDGKVAFRDIVIYDGKVAFINYEGEVSSSIVLQSADLYHVAKELFDFVWGLLPPSNSENRDSFEEPTDTSELLG